MNLIVVCSIISFIFFSAGGFLLAVKHRRVKLTPSEYIPLFLSFISYAFVTLSNVLEHLEITNIFDPIEDVVELFFLFMCMLFINNWRAQRALEDLQLKELKLNAALEELSKQEQRYRYLVESANDAIFITQNGKITFCNSKTSDLLGYSEEEITSSVSFLEFVAPEDRERVLLNHQKRLRQEKNIPSTYQFKVINKEGATLTIQINSVYVDWNGQPAALSFARDMTDQIKLEQNLFQAQKMESIGTLAGGVAHDFNNILGAIIGFSELAKTNVPPDNVAFSHLEKVLAAGDRAKELVKQILTFSRHSPRDLQPVEFHLIVKEALKLLRSSIPTTIEIRREIDSENGLVFSEATHLHQIVMNLCTNAYHAMRETGGVLAVSLKKVYIEPDNLKTKAQVLASGPYLELEVSDTGSGMNRETIENIFDPYFTTKKKGEGTGLGLAVVHGIVKNYGGHISVYSEPGRGSTFKVFLPRVNSRENIRETLPQTACPTGTEKALVVDDDSVLADLIGEMLSNLGYRVTAITDSNEAFLEFEKNADGFDFVITDMTMPNLDGVHLIRKIKAIRQNIPIILCTGFSELVDGEKAAEIGVKKFLMKPVSRIELATAVRDVLDR